MRTPHAELEYLDEGPRDGRPVVLVHGFPDEPSTWDGVVSALPEGLRVIRPTLRGVGRSTVTDPDARSGQVAALATDLLDVIGSLELGRSSSSVTTGVRAAHAAASLAPAAVSGLVTISTAYGPGSGLTPRERLHDASVAWYRYWLTWGLGGWWKSLPIVRQQRWLV